MDAYQNKILQVLRSKKVKQPLPPKEIAKRAGIKPAHRDRFMRALEALVAERKIIEQNGKYLAADGAGLVPAEIVKITSTFGFARQAGADRDVFIPGRHLHGAMPGDQVLLRLKSSSGQLPEGEVVQIAGQARRTFSGVLRVRPDGSFVEPDSYVRYPIRVARGKTTGARDGDKVLAQLQVQEERHADHTVRVLEAFGNADSAQACCRALLAAGDIYPEFPPEALEQARAIAAGEGIHPKELAVRTDLRGELIFTIDGADSKDLDDAVSLRKHENGWELGVHIADVSYYVTHMSPLDLEAYARGTSVYYADSVVPMLPPELSNGICSLNPGEDRLAFSAFISLGKDGHIAGYAFKKTVIRSRVKGIYDEVNRLLAGTADAAVREKYAELTAIIEELAELAAILTKNRYARGGMDIDSAESKIIIGADGKAVDVRARERGQSERIIEELMLTANEAAARFALAQGLPFVYRVHENPAPDKVTALYDLLDSLGVKARRPKNGVSSAQLAEILDKVRGTELEAVVNTTVLRTMAKAKYSEHNTGHFGLALDDYAHFTSPIRRYPDLTIHRVLSGQVTGMRRDNILKRFGGFVGKSALRSTEREIAAMTAERGCEDCYKAEYMQRFVGAEFSGVVSGVTPFGVYVRLDNTVEGLCALDGLPDGDWSYDGVVTMTDRLHGARLRLGDKARVKVLAAHVSAGQVDFALCGTAAHTRGEAGE